MKKLFFSVLIFLAVGISLYAQGEMVTGELSFYIINNGGGAFIEIEMELVSPLCWDANVSYPDLHNITDLFNGGAVSDYINNG